VRRLSKRDRIIVALDTTNLNDARAVVEKLQGSARWFKVGMELFYSAGWQAVEMVSGSGASVFLDLKFNDIPNTVQGAFRSCLRPGVGMINMHTTAGLEAMKSAMQQVQQIEVHARPMVIGVTVLTSLDEAALNEQLGMPGSVMQNVTRLAGLAKQAGLCGVVASPLETRAIKQACGQDMIVVTPGVRPVWSGTQDQRRFASPAQAFADGADYIVIGRPVTAAVDPLSAYERIAEEVEAQQGGRV